MVQDKTIGSRLFDMFNYTFLFIVALVTIVPFIFIVAGSFTAPEELAQKSFVLFPTRFSLSGYKYIFSTETILRSVGVSIYITLLGTLINLVLTSLMAYPLARRELLGRRWFMLMLIVTLLFNGGLIPTFLVVKGLGMLNTYWSVLIPGAISTFNLIVLRNFFMQLPDGLEESAKIDGCNDLGILVRIVLPLSLPALATFALFYAVGHWNQYFQSVLYINDNAKWPVQVWLRQIVILSQGGVGDSSSYSDSDIVPPGQVVKMAVIVISTVPIMCVYPFLQKHFAKGAMVGSIKG